MSNGQLGQFGLNIQNTGGEAPQERHDRGAVPQSTPRRHVFLLHSRYSMRRFQAHGPVNAKWRARGFGPAPTLPSPITARPTELHA